MSEQNKTSLPAGRFAYEGLDRVLHEKARLGILVSLSTRPEGLLFGELKQLCGLTDGNLNRHLHFLARPGEELVEIEKVFVNRRPQTRCRLTPKGRARFLEYLGELERVLRDAQAEAEPAPPGLNLAAE
jgi:hypothetical protein